MFDVKLIIAAIVLCVIALIGFNVKHHYKTKWQDEIHAEYKESERIAIVKRNDEIERVKHEQTETNRKVVTDYENQLKSLSDRLADAKRIGLRVPKNTCNGFAATTETTSTEGNHETEYVRLPERIEIGLFRIVERAEEINIQLGACQSWIIQNGFYPSDLSSTPNK